MLCNIRTRLASGSYHFFITYWAYETSGTCRFTLSLRSLAYASTDILAQLRQAAARGRRHGNRTHRYGTLGRRHRAGRSRGGWGSRRRQALAAAENAAASKFTSRHDGDEAKLLGIEVVSKSRSKQGWSEATRNDETTQRGRATCPELQRKMCLHARPQNGDLGKSGQRRSFGNAGVKE